MRIPAHELDVIIVGYGPTGLTLASLLGQAGHHVGVVERWPQLYGKPRLTHIDGETARLISLVCDADQALRDSWTTPHYYWMNGRGKVLMNVAQDNARRMLWDDHISVHQPHIESAIHERITALKNVQLLRGYEAISLEQGSGGVQLTCEAWSKRGGQPEKASTPIMLTARYLIGADGSKSFVRESLGVERIDFGFNERWLCVDTEPLRPLPPKFTDDAFQMCDPRRGYMFMPIGRQRQRFEFALLPTETTEHMQTEEAAWQLLRQYHDLGRADLKLIRNLVYTFECRLARTWRVGNVFLAGDAAHTNPPYLGQGACSGMRDASNLAWKLDLVLRGRAEEALLNTYEAERRPHAQKLMLDSRSLGLVANTSNPVKAAIRDLAFALRLVPKPKFPVLETGVLARDAAGKLQRSVGGVPAQGRIGGKGHEVRFDERVGFKFALVCRSSAVDAIESGLSVRLAALNVAIVSIDDDGLPRHPSAVSDPEGVYRGMLETLACDVIVIRPDFVLYGYAKTVDAPALLEGLALALHIRP